MERIASIDIGSNTLRLLIVEKKGGRIYPLFRDREIVRLGGRFYPDLLLAPQAVEQALKVLRRFQKRIKGEEVEEVWAVATGVLREALNSQNFLKRVKEEVGIEVRIISGQEEAQLTAAGVLSVFPEADQGAVLFDIGGGSTEFVRFEKGDLEEVVSLPLGVVGLTEVFLKNDPPLDEEVGGLRGVCRNILRKNLTRHDRLNALIGTAGTATTLAAMVKGMEDYRPEEINGTTLGRNWLETLTGHLLRLKTEERAALKGLEAGRADIIVAGCLLVLEIMDFWDKETLQVSDAGLLEGVILKSGGEGQRRPPHPYFSTS